MPVYDVRRFEEDLSDSDREEITMPKNKVKAVYTHGSTADPTNTIESPIDLSLGSTEYKTFGDTGMNWQERTGHPLIMENVDNSIQLDEDTYEMDKFIKNAMMIFNHEKFLADAPRRGTALDVLALKDTFERFQFEVTTHHDLSRQRLFDVLNKFSRRDFADYGCVCVAILTHGLDDGYLKASDTRYRERDAFACFDCLANPSLVGKPIIFLIQACRGPYAAYAVCEGQVVEFDGVSKEVRPPESDMIIFHSSFIGRASVRVINEGTWFIQTVCEQMKLYASTEHLEKVFRRVRRVVALEKEYEGAKQMPVVTTTLLKKLYLKEELIIWEEFLVANFADMEGLMLEIRNDRFVIPD